MGHNTAICPIPPAPEALPGALEPIAPAPPPPARSFVIMIVISCITFTIVNTVSMYHTVYYVLLCMIMYYYVLYQPGFRATAYAQSPC